MKFVYFLCLVSLFSCTKRGSEFYEAVDLNKIDSRLTVIVIPGFYGSALREVKSKRRAFLSLSDLISGSFQIGLSAADLGTPYAPEIEAEGMIGSLSVVPMLYQLKFYSEIVEPLLAKNVQVIPLVYDWRADPTAAVAQLEEIVNALAAKKAPVSIVAHSMGGLIAAYYLAYGNQPPESAQISWDGAKHIRKVAFIGTPFAGSMSIVKDMQDGADFPLKKNVISAEQFASFPSAYFLLPTGIPNLFYKSGQNLNESLYSVSTWQRLKMGLLRNGNISEGFKTNRLNFLNTILPRAKAFMEKVQIGNNDSWPAPKTLAVLNIVGKNRRTLDGAFYELDKLYFDEEEIKNLKLNPYIVSSEGDGVVSSRSAELPAALKYSSDTWYTDKMHTMLYTDPALKPNLINFLSN